MQLCFTATIWKCFPTGNPKTWEISVSICMVVFSRDMFFFHSEKVTFKRKGFCCYIVRLVGHPSSSWGLLFSPHDLQLPRTVFHWVLDLVSDVPHHAGDRERSVVLHPVCGVLWPGEVGHHWWSQVVQDHASCIHVQSHQKFEKGILGPYLYSGWQGL